MVASLPEDVIAAAGPDSIESNGMLSREMLVERIQALNPTASADYLLRFTGVRLSLYLDHLAATSVPRGREARWLRPGDTPGILGFVPGEED